MFNIFEKLDGKNKNHVDESGWLFCRMKNACEKHEPDKMMITYFIPLESNSKFYFLLEDHAF